MLKYFPYLATYMDCMSDQCQFVEGDLHVILYKIKEWSTKTYIVYIPLFPF